MIRTVQLLSWLQHFGKSKVRYLHIQVIIEQYVLGLQIPVHYSLIMHVLQPLEHLPHDVTSLLFGERDDGREVVEQLPVFTQFEDQEYKRAGFEDVVQLDWKQKSNGGAITSRWRMEKSESR